MNKPPMMYVGKRESPSQRCALPAPFNKGAFWYEVKYFSEHPVKIIFDDMRVKNGADSEGIASLQKSIVSAGRDGFLIRGWQWRGMESPVHKS